MQTLVYIVAVVFDIADRLLGAVIALRTYPFLGIESSKEHRGCTAGETGA